ncbi:MAG: oligosaccharide flippase family protein [Paracoccaceae bacterium]
MTLPDWARLEAGAGGYSRQRGIGRSIGLNTISAVFQLLGAVLSTVILSRILQAEDFGVYGMIMPFVGVLLIIIDGGAVYYILRSPKVVEREVSFLFWYTVIFGAGLTVLLFMALPFIAWAMEEPRVLGAGAVAATVLLFSALGSQHGAMMMRCFRNDLRAIAIIGGVIAGVATALALGYAGFGYWALVALLVIRVAVTSGLNLALSGWLPMLRVWDRGLLKDVVRLARSSLGERIILGLVRESDKIIVGVLFSTAAAGYYVLAQMLAVMPLLQIISPTFTVVLPYLSEMKSDPSAMFAKFWNMLCIFVYVFWPPCVFASLFAVPLFQLVLGPEMQGSVEPFRVLIISGVAALTFTFSSLAPQAVDRPDIVQRQNLFAAGIFAVCYAAAAIIGGGVVAIATATLVANVLANAMRFRDYFRFFSFDAARALGRLGRTLALGVVAPVLVFALSASLGPAGLTGYAVVDLVAFSGLFLVIYAGLGCWLFDIDPRQALARLWRR